MDTRGIPRGSCTVCQHCPGYIPPSNGLKCSQCGCPPARHINLNQPETGWDTSSGHTAATVPNDDFAAFTPCALSAAYEHATSLCAVSACHQVVEFDMNSGVEYRYCSIHMHFTMSSAMFVEDIEDEQMVPGGQDQNIMGFYQAQGLGLQAPALVKDSSMCNIPECFKSKYVDMGSGVIHDYCGRTHAEEGKRRGITPSQQSEEVRAANPFQGAQSQITATGLPKCAISECPNACYVDDSRTVHECCGITHAMEHQRRQALWQQVNQQVVKGITHCLLPECNRQTWPFENYCGRTHADVGKQRGLVPPPPVGQTQAGPKDSSLCIIPGCQKAKFVDSSTGATHDYCGKNHAAEGKRRGIFATADKVEDQCDLPGCTNRKKTEGGTVYDYCCRDHATQDAPNRDARLLTARPEVDKFLKKFSNLKVVSIKENDHAKPGGALFNKFKNAMMSLPTSQRNTCLAFHGTAESNIDSICQTGYDPKRRCGQAYGAGEYFATSPNTPMSYCKGGKKMLLNELLLGQSGTHHTKHGDIVVMKKSEHDLPRFVITFQ